MSFFFFGRDEFIKFRSLNSDEEKENKNTVGSRRRQSISQERPPLPMDLLIE